METVQKLVPFFEELLQQWYQLTLHNQEYAICLAVSVWLLTAVFYSIRIGFLKSSAGKILKAKQEIQAGLDEAKQQLETLQQQLVTATQQMQAAEQTAQAESQRAATFEARLQQSNRNLAVSLANLVECFELNLQNLPAAEADNLLPEYDAVIARVVERFQNEQQAKTQLQLNMHAETAKLAEKDMLISSLESRLDTQTQQLVKLELAAEQFHVAQKQLELDKQQLAQELQNRASEVLRQQVYEKPAAPVTQAPIQTAVQSIPEPVKPVEAAEKVSETRPVEPEIKPEPVPVTSKPQAPVSKASAAKTAKPAAGNKMKGLFGRAMDKFSKMDEKLGSPGKATIEPEVVEVAETGEAVADVVEQTAAQEPVKNLQANKSAGDKLSGLFGGFKKSSAPKPEVKIEREEPVPPVVDEAKPAAEMPAGKANKATSQLTGLFGKFKSKK